MQTTWAKNSQCDWEQRKLEIERLAIEPAIEAWNQLTITRDEERSASDLGFSSRYFRNLILQEFVNKLNQGMNFTELPKLNSDLDYLCWRAACSQIKSDLQNKVESPICIQLRSKLLNLHKSGNSLDEVSQRLDLTKSQAKTLVMLAFLESGLTLDQIGAEFQVTREAARRAMERNLGISVRLLRQYQATKKEAQQTKSKESIESWINSHPGCRISEITAFFCTTEAEVRELRPGNLRRLVLGGRKKYSSTNYSRFSPEKTFKALSLAYALKNSLVGKGCKPEPLTGPFYEQARTSGEIVGPSMARIIQVFGTWKAACEKADVPSVDAIRNSYDRRWTDEQLVEQIAEFILTTESHSHEKFDEWSRPKYSVASLGTIRKQLGSWSDSYELALLHLRKKWADN